MNMSIYERTDRVTEVLTDPNRNQNPGNSKNRKDAGNIQVIENTKNTNNTKTHLSRKSLSFLLAAILMLMMAVPASAATATNSDGALNSDGAVNSDGKKVEASAEASANANSVRVRSFALSGRSVALSTAASQPTTGWHTIDGYKYYYYATGKYYASKMVTISGKKYLFDKDGHLLYGICKHDNKTYYASSAGVIQTTAGFVTVDGAIYYVASGGEIACGKTFQVSGKTYKAYSTGKVATGVFKYGKDYYYADSKGAVRSKAGFITYGGSRYYVTKGGKLKTGCTFTVNNHVYKAFNNGKLGVGVFKYGKNYYYAYKDKYYIRRKAGFITYEGSRYYVTNGGKLKVGCTFTVNNHVYKAFSTGKLGVGVFKYGKNYYYAYKDKYYIRRKAGFVWWNNKRYYVSDGGKLLVSKTFTKNSKTYKIFSDGHIGLNVFKYGSKYYFADKYGVVPTKTGVQTYKSKYYYVKKGGQITTSQMITSGSKKYYANSDGTLKTGLFTVDNVKYYASSKGQITTKAGFLVKSGNVYYIQSGGAIACGKTFKVNKKTYKAFSDGHLGTGLFKYGSYYYYADSAGAIKTTAGLITVSGKKYYVNSGGKIAVSTTLVASGKTYQAAATGVLTQIKTAGDTLIDIAQKEVGTKTGKKYWEAYFGTTFKNGDSTPWCGTFVTWCFKKAGLYSLIEDIEDYGNLGYVPSYTKYANAQKKKGNNIWVSASTAKAGDIIIFGSSSHVGLVKSVVGNIITTIEGNTGTTSKGEVKEKTYSLTNSWIMGIIRVIA
jgi:glucan-binding YG repeat protein